MLVAPSLLSADFANLQRDIEELNLTQADYYHIDIMDGIFVPNISYGFPVCEVIHKYAKKPLDFHLMIQQPDLYIQSCIQSGAKIISVHYEACVHLERTVSYIHSQGVVAGVALNPHTPIHLLEDLLHKIDIVLIMSVNPGFGGQQFIPHTLKKVERLRQMIDSTKSPAQIEVDGGVHLKNVHQLKEAGADIIVAGNAVFSSENRKQTIADLKS